MTSKCDFVLALIAMYKERTCLWKASDPGYHDKKSRNQALEEILELFKTVDANATKDTVNRKINSMRGSFRKELNKVRASEKSGARGNDVHEPKLWYFKKMLFLEGHDVEIPSQSHDSFFSNMHFLCEEAKINQASDDDDALEMDSSGTTIARLKFSKRPLSKADQLLHKFAKRIETEKQVQVKEKYKSFGDHVAEKLRNMPPEMVSISQKLISDAIFYGETRQLNMTSRIVTKHEVVMPPPSSVTFTQCEMSTISPSIASSNDESQIIIKTDCDTYGETVIS